MSVQTAQAEPSTPAGRRVKRVVARLLAELRPPVDRRSESREPFFCPATLRIGSAEQGSSIQAFTREMSESAIGLVHRSEAPTGDGVLTLRHPHGNPVYLRCRVLWCAPAGDGWYLSAVKLIDVTFAD